MKAFLKTLFLLLAATSVWGQSSLDSAKNSNNGGVIADTVRLGQLDGTILTLVSFGNLFENYTETIDGYTVLNNEVGLFVYAKKGKKGALVPSKIVAHDPIDRDRKEVKKVNRMKKHLRLSGAAKRATEKRAKKFNVNPKYRYRLER